MYVPVIMDPCAFYEYRYLWEYLKYMYHCYENDWPIVSRESYGEYKKYRPVSNVYEEEFSALHQYHVLTEAQEAQVKKFFIPEKIFLQLEEQLGSKLAVKVHLLRHRYQPLEHEIKKIFHQIERSTDRKIDGIMNWNAHFKSIRHVAEKMHIPVITNEFCIRFPDYYPLAYFCKKDIYAQQEIKDLYHFFLKEKEKISFDLLSRKEILTLFLNVKCISKLEEAEHRTPEYEIGIAGCHPLIATFFAKTMYTDLELIEDVRHFYKEEDILFRMHPGDEPYQAAYTLKNKDDSQTAIDFILDCKRITAIGSNTLLEAMLWGKQVYSKDVSPYTFFAEKMLQEKESGYISDEILNFIFFVYLVPYNRVLEEAYITWRLNERSCSKILEKNICYYFHEMGIPESVLYLGESRSNTMLEYRLKGERNE